MTKNVMELYKSSGTIANSYTYAPFGEATQTGNITNPLQWSSEVFDGESGLVYYNYRHYNPHDGRWTSRDPVGMQGGYNLYAFIHNKVLKELDDLGLFGSKERCCCGKKKLPDKFCCENNQIVNPKSCSIRILMGHSFKNNLKRNIKLFCKIDRIGIVSCYSTETNAYITISQSYPNDGRNSGLIKRGKEAAKQEARICVAKRIKNVVIKSLLLFLIRETGTVKEHGR